MVVRDDKDKLVFQSLDFEIIQKDGVYYRQYEN